MISQERMGSNVCKRKRPRSPISNPAEHSETRPFPPLPTKRKLGQGGLRPRSRLDGRRRKHTGPEPAGLYCR